MLPDEEVEPRVVEIEEASVSAIKEWEDKVKPIPSFTFVHLKSKCQGLLDYKVQDVDWTDYLSDSWDEYGRCFINNYLQTKPVHYHVKKWLTDEHIKRLEELA